MGLSFEAGENQQRRCGKKAKGQRREVRESKTSRFSAKERPSCLPTIEKKKKRKLGLVLRWKKFDTASQSPERTMVENQHILKKHQGPGRS